MPTAFLGKQTINEQDLKRSFSLSGQWFLNSGIQNQNSALSHRGGVSAWYDLQSASHSFLYGEITGYAVNLFLYFYQTTGQFSFLERAKQAGEWLLVQRTSLYPLVVNRVHLSHAESYFDSWIFTFDQWMIIYGLCNLFESTKDRRFLTAAQEQADFLIRETFQSDGSMLPVFDLESGRALEPGDKWSRQSGSFHAKALFGLHRLSELSGNESYLEIAKKLTEFSLLEQKTTGRFVTQTNEDSTHLHPHLYSIEGLSYWFSKIKDPKTIQACADGLKWIFHSQQENGRINSFFISGNFLPYERVDVLAQTLRTAVILDQSKPSEIPTDKIDFLASRLSQYQIQEGSQAGGFFYGQEQDGTIHYHVNSWVTMFAAQALWIYRQHRFHNEKYNFSFFV